MPELKHYTWPSGAGPDFITVPASGRVIDITSYDDIFTVPPARIETITVAYLPNAPQTGRSRVVFSGPSGSRQYDYPAAGTATYDVPPDTDTMTHIFEPENDAPNIPVHIEFPYENGRTVSFGLKGTTIQLGIGGLFVTGAVFTGDFPGVHYFADPGSHTEVYFRGSPDVGGGEIGSRGEFGSGVYPPTPGDSGIATPYDPGFGIGEYQRNKAAFQRKYVTFTANIIDQEPAQYFRDHPTEYLMPRRSVAIPGYFELLIGSLTTTPIFGVRYQAPTVNNSDTGNGPPRPSTVLTAQIGDQRGFFTGRTRT